MARINNLTCYKALWIPRHFERWSLPDHSGFRFKARPVPDTVDEMIDLGLG